MYEITATYKGIVPMMHDRFYDPSLTEKPPIKKKKGRDEEEIKRKCYHDKQGVYIPADNIRMMLLGNKHRRGAAQILGSDIHASKGTRYRSICEGCIWTLGLDNPQKVYIQPKRLVYDDVDERSFINATGSRSMSYRPVITVPWSITFVIQVTDDNLDQSWVRQLFDVAGLRCGIGAYGPTFGRCVIDKWKTKK